MNFSIIGSGNIAHYFAERCLVAGHNIVEVISSNKETGSALADQVNGTFLTDFKESKSDTFLLAIPDDTIRSLSGSSFFEDKYVLHTSGSIGLNEITELSEHIACLWPIYSIQREKLPVRNDVPFVMQSSNLPMRKRAVRIAKCITNNVIEATDEQKSILHLAAVLVNNFTNHLFVQSEQLLLRNGLDFKLLLPIIQNTIQKLSETTPTRLQTGPAIRGDQKTIEEHLKLLQSDHNLQRVYSMLSESIQNLN